MRLRARSSSRPERVVSFEGPRLIEAKGKDDPVEAWVALEPLARAAQRGVEGLSAPLVGRDAELDVLLALAQRVERERAPQLVTLFGQAGVGKSRLLVELIDRLGRGARFLRGRCLPYGDGITYWPLAEVAKSHAGVLETDSATVAVQKLQSAVAATVAPEDSEAVLAATTWTIGLSLPGEQPTGFGSPDVRGRLYDAWTRYIAGLGRQRLTVVAIEDVHWASEPLLDLLEHVAATLEGSSVLIICPARPEFLDVRPTWGAGKQNATALTLQPLGRHDAARLVEELLRVDEVGEAARSRILERAEGNPFFVEEILRMLIDRGALERRDGGWVAAADIAEVPLPDSVHGVIAARIDLLDAVSREALRHCAVMGRIFWPAAVGIDEQVVSTLSRRGLVAEQASSVVAGMREFSFKHALTRDVAYETLPRHERRTLHRRVGEWIEHVAPGRATETAELAAYHYVEAIRYGDDDPAATAHAVDLLLEAGWAAVERAALASAVSLFAQARDLATTPEARSRALLGLGRTATGAGRDDEALTLLDEARLLAHEAGSPWLEADVLSWMTRASWLAGRWTEAMSAVTQAVEILDGLEESPELARALARRSQMEMLRGLPSVEDHSLQAIEVARRVGDRFAEANARINLVTARVMRGKEPEESEYLEIIDGAIDAGAYDEAFRGVVNLLWGAGPYFPVDKLDASVERALSKLEDVAWLESYDEYLLLSRAKFLWIPSARWTEIDAIVYGPESAVAGGTKILWYEVVAGTLIRRGQLERADAMLPVFRRLAIESEEPQRILPMAGVVLPRAAMTRDRDTILSITETIVGLPGRQYWTLVVTPSIPRALATAGELEALERFAATLEEGKPVGELRIARAVTRGHLALARSGADDAVTAFGEALTLERARGAHYSAACAELDLALALEAAGDRAKADAARARAAAVLKPLRCVNPV